MTIEAKKKKKKEGNVNSETRSYTVGFEDEGKGHEPRKAKSAILEAGKAREQILL